MTTRGILLGLGLTLTAAVPFLAGAHESREALEARIQMELRAQSPAAESLFTAARESELRFDFTTSTQLYHRAGEVLPGNPHIMRREGLGLVRLGSRYPGLELLRNALAKAYTPENLGSLAYGLILTPEGVSPSSDELQQARGYVEEAIRLDPDDIDSHFLLAQVALMLGDEERLRGAVKALRAQAPDSMMTHYFAAFVEAIDGRRPRALSELDAAHRSGLADDQYKAISEVVAKLRPSPAVQQRNLLMLTGWTLAIWLGGLLVLLLAGLGLSATVIRRARQVPNSADGRVAGLDALLRRLYAGVLWISCAYYYVSMPLLVVLVLAMTGGLIYGFFVLGHVPIKLALLIVVLALVTVWSIVRSLFVRVADEDPGIKLDLDGVPRLRHLLERVATRIGTRPVDNVYMTAGTDIAVFERGGMLRQLRGKSERCLILGAGVLHGFRLGPFRAVLGHEYGHFSNRDTAGGGFALAVRRSLVTMAVCIAQSGAAAWYNPAWLFLNGFHRVFLRISHGASRLQEILADRWAAFSYGAAAFERGLRHVIEASVRFDARANAALKEAIEKKLPLSNLYAHGPSSGDDEAAIDKAVEAALVAEPSPYDSHPRPADRFAWVKTLSTPDIETAADDEEEVWSLFPDRWEMERRMTEEVRTAVKQQHGIEIPATA